MNAQKDPSKFQAEIFKLLSEVSGFVAIREIAAAVILLTGWGQWFESEDRVRVPEDCILSKPPKLGDLRDA